MDSIEIYRGVEVLITAKPKTDSIQTKAVMGDNGLKLVFEFDNYIDFRIGDWCTVFDEKYLIFKTPIVEKTSQFNWTYTLTFSAEGVIGVSNVQYLYPGHDNQLTNPFFPLVANAKRFMQLLLDNLERVYPGQFSIGQVIDTDYKSMVFNGENCYNVLSRLATEFETEFWIEGKVLHLTKRTFDTGYKFEQGRYKGLYDVTRKDLNNASIATRIWVAGSDKNLPADYRGYEPRLLLPDFHPGLIRNLTVTKDSESGGYMLLHFHFDPATTDDVKYYLIAYRPEGSTGSWKYGFAYSTLAAIKALVGTYEVRIITKGGAYDGLSTPTFIVGPDGISTPIFTEAPRYIEKNVDLYGVIEHTEIFSDVYPRRTGIVSGVNAGNPFEFTDASMNFDLMAYLQPGLEPKVVFNTGQLTGYSFKITSYDDAAKKFIILKNEAERNQVVPSASLRPAIGDEYVIIDIRMPQEYIDAAESELLTKAQALLETVSQPQVSYAVNIDPVYAKRKGYALSIGQMVWLKDKQINLEKKIRIVKTIRSVVEEEKYQIELSDIVSPATMTRILAATADNTRAIDSINRSILNNAVLNNEVVGTLRFSDMPQTSTLAGFLPVYMEASSGKLYVKV